MNEVVDAQNRSCGKGPSEFWSGWHCNAGLSCWFPFLVVVVVVGAGVRQFVSAVDMLTCWAKRCSVQCPIVRLVTKWPDGNTIKCVARFRCLENTMQWPTPPPPGRFTTGSFAKGTHCWRPQMCFSIRPD